MLTNADGQPSAVGQQAIPGGRSAGDPTPVGSGGMGPTALCQNTRCLWRQPDPILESMGAPKGWTWPHHHEGDAVVLHLEIG